MSYNFPFYVVSSFTIKLSELTGTQGISSGISAPACSWKELYLPRGRGTRWVFLHSHSSCPCHAAAVQRTNSHKQMAESCHARQQRSPTASSDLTHFLITRQNDLGSLNTLFSAKIMKPNELSRLGLSTELVVRGKFTATYSFHAWGSHFLHSLSTK